MSNTLVIKNSSVTGHVPVGTDLVEAEIAVNTADKKLFTKDAQGNVVEIGMEVNSQTVEAALGFVPANQATTYTKTETDTRINAVIGAAPQALNTLSEIATQLASDESAAASIVTLVGTKAPLASPAFTGIVSGITKAMVGLSNVNNTSDLDKPNSYANINSFNAETSARIAADLLLAPKATTYTKTEVDAVVAAEATRAISVEILKADKTYVDTALSSMGSSSGSLTNDFSVKKLAVSGDILPAISGVSSIGSPTDKFRSIYTQELHIDANTLYVDGVPVIGSSANTIQISADLNQGMRIATSGTGQLILDSQTATTIQTNGTNADVVFQAIGTGSLARITSSTQVALTAPVVNIQGNESISGDLIVAGNMTVNGTTTAVNTTNMTVKDNIVTVNKGELGSGVSLRYAGFEVDRGDLARERLIWDETVGKWVAGQTSQEVALATEPFVAAAIAASTSSVTLTSLGLGNVSNTSDANKPVSTAQAAAIALKASVADLTTETSARIAADLLLAPQATTYTKTQVDSAIAAENTRATTVEALKANQATTYTKTETDSRIQAVVGAAPAALDTLAEIATQLASDESAASALVTTVSSKASTADLSTLQAALQTLITNEVNRALAAEATKASIASLSVVATSGSYNDLTNKPSNSGATWASFQ